MNAAAVAEAIRSLVPKYAIKHYRYIRHSMPKLIPSIDEFEANLHYKSSFTLISDGQIMKQEDKKQQTQQPLETMKKEEVKVSALNKGFWKLWIL